MVTWTTCFPFLVKGSVRELHEEDILTLSASGALHRAWHRAGLGWFAWVNDAVISEVLPSILVQCGLAERGFVGDTNSLHSVALADYWWFSLLNYLGPFGEHRPADSAWIFYYGNGGPKIVELTFHRHSVAHVPLTVLDIVGLGAAHLSISVG